MKKKITRISIALLAILIIIPLFAAYEAHVINVKAHIENALAVNPTHIDFGSVFPQEGLQRDFRVTLSDSFQKQDRVIDVKYKIVQKLKPDIPLDLRPYIIKLRDPIEDASEPLDTVGEASLDKSKGDLSDHWLVKLRIPCLKGSECQEMADSGNLLTCEAVTCPTYPCGPTAPEEGDYGMDIWVEVVGYSYPPPKPPEKPPLSKKFDGPTEVPINTFIEWYFYFQVNNIYSYTMTDVELTDRFGAELDVEDYYDVTFVYKTDSWSFEQFTSFSGRQDRFRWYIGNLPSGDTGTLILKVTTKLNPAGKQQYTSPGVYQLNSGATLKWMDDGGVQQSITTDSLSITAYTP